MRLRFVYIFMGILSFFYKPSFVDARDLRLALLVANEDGWNKEPQLKGAISGDLSPLAKILSSRLGFKIVRLTNGSAGELRKVFKKIQKLTDSSNAVKTFLFYYSGHADKKFFHLRKVAGEKAFSYREFVRSFLKLRVKRRFALLDACDSSMILPRAAWHTAGHKTPYAHKGSKNNQLHNIQRWLLQHEKHIAKGRGYRKRKVDLQKVSLITRKQNSGLYIIASNGNAYHNNRLGASVFTRHFIRGLKGQADINSDGKMTLDELYHYARLKSQQESGQKMDRLVFFRGDYRFAPNYRGKLLLARHIKGKIHISVGSFTVQHTKKMKRLVLLPVLDGSAKIWIQQDDRCWFQKLSISRTKPAKLNRYGRRLTCKKWRRDLTQKGDERLILSVDELELTELPPPRQMHTLSFYGGYTEQSHPPLRAPNAHLSFGYRWNNLLGASLEYELSYPVSFTIHRFSLALELGYTLHQAPARWSLFLGCYVRPGLISQISDVLSPRYTYSISTGIQLELQVRISRSWGVRFGGRVGADYTPTTNERSISPQWFTRAAILYLI